MQPQASDNLNSPSHSLLHRIFAADAAASVKTINIDSSSNVGIGTETPNNKLTVSGTADITGNLNVGITTGNARVTVFQDTAGTKGLFVDFDASTGNAFTIDGEQTTSSVMVMEADKLTSGRGILLNMDNTAMTSAIGIKVVNDVDSAGNTWTGNLAYFYSDNTDTSSRKLVDIVNDDAASTGTILLGLQQDAPASSISASDSNTTWGAASIANASLQWLASSLTTGRAVSIYSNASSVAARELVRITNDNAAAVGVTPFIIQQDALVNTNFKLIATFGTTNIYESDGTTAEGNLTGTLGDICFNGSSVNGGMAFCDANGTNWTDM